VYIVGDDDDDDERLLRGECVTFKFVDCRSGSVPLFIVSKWITLEGWRVVALSVRTKYHNNESLRCLRNSSYACTKYIYYNIYNCKIYNLSEIKAPRLITYLGVARRKILLVRLFSVWHTVQLSSAMIEIGREYNWSADGENFLRQWNIALREATSLINE